MKAKYLDPMIDSFADVMESLAKVKFEKGELKKKDRFETEKEYVMPINISGDLNGYFIICFNKDTALKIITSMTSEMGLPPMEEVDEMGKSCLIEAVGITRSKFIKLFNELEIKCEVKVDQIYTKDELPLYPDELSLEFNLVKEEESIELNISLF